MTAIGQPKRQGETRPDVMPIPAPMREAPEQPIPDRLPDEIREPEKVPAGV